jgi:hypothetical protein
MNGSNVVITSNVYLRSGEPLNEDFAFIRQVRGRVAVNRLLERIAPGSDPKSAARGFLSARQIAEAAWQGPCTCGAYPEGPVRQNGDLDVQFRCPMQHCESNHRRARRCMLDLKLINYATQTMNQDIRAIIATALAAVPLRHAAIPPAECERRPVPVMLTLYQDNFLTDSDIEDALRRYLEVSFESFG